jgi:uncharacterized membrane-anchored protein
MALADVYTAIGTQITALGLGTFAVAGIVLGLALYVVKRFIKR